MSNKDVAEAFANHEAAKAEHFFTDGKTVYSYGHHFPIATWFGDKVLFNDASYSNTTSHHQGRVRQALARHGIPFEVVKMSVVRAAENTNQDEAVKQMLSEEEREKG